MLSGDAVDNPQASRARRYRVRMIPSHTSARVASVLVLLAVLGGAAVGCGAKRPPSPTPTPLFASEEEAFAAAEETYRAYNEAGNRERAGDEAADSMSFLTGDALENEIASTRELLDAGVELRGDIQVLEFVGLVASIESRSSAVTSTVCLDVSAVHAVDEAGNLVTATGRSDVYGVDLTFVERDSSLKILRFEVSASIPC